MLAFEILDEEELEEIRLTLLEHDVVAGPPIAERASR